MLLLLFFVCLLLLNCIIINLYRKGKVSLIVSGFAILIGFISEWLLFEKDAMYRGVFIEETIFSFTMIAYGTSLILTGVTITLFKRAKKTNNA